MMKCWNEDSESRPLFEDLVRLTADILNDARQSVKRRSRTSEPSSAVTKASNPYENGIKTEETRYAVWLHLVGAKARKKGAT